ncbi:hypothetical protein JCM17844_03940 [Iodidimonas gelatinilytica]|uniref:Uncharacterized protein n=1 Tax=Iodidimonas gelatinilytica TaxID=1236966 RepID=A0A5A7MLG7_9PROT|nr:hypothetical protein JCM17844_03940 [Iodidimonas gelatinilytica]
MANGAAKAAHLQQEQAKLTRDMDAAEERWLMAQEALEKVKQPKEMADK